MGDVNPMTFRLTQGSMLFGVRGLLGICLACTAVVCFLFMSYAPRLADLTGAHLDLRKEITTSVDSRFPVDIAFDHRFDFRLRKEIPLELPVRADLRVPLDETFLVPLPDSFSVQLASPLFVDEEIRVRSEVPLDITVQARIFGIDVSIPIKGSVPIDFAFPLRQEIAVRGDLSLRVADPLRVHLRQAVRVPVDFVMQGVLDLDEQITVPIETAMQGRVSIPEPLACTVEMRMSATDWGRGIRLTR